MFSIISVGKNCENFIEGWYKSIINQSNENWTCFVALDPSFDNSVKKLFRFIQDDKRFIVDINKETNGASRNRYICTSKEVNKDSIVVHLDLDDSFYNNKVLDRVYKEYQRHDCWLTYGSYICSNGVKDNWNKSIPKKVWRNNSHRRNIWSTTALRTFKKWLWDHIDYNDFIYKGEWIEKCTDMACMFPMLEMAGPKRVRYIRDILYFYNIYNNQSSISRKKESLIESYIRSIKPYKRIE
ncbi:MAG: glycosyltransferase [Atribacterota bacterium]